MDPSDKNRHRGKVAWFNPGLGIGYITPDDRSLCPDGKDLFVHFHFIVMRDFKTLDQGDIVEFRIGSNHKGPCAVEVKLIEPANKGASA